jgi:hypothetical protein
VLFPALNGLLWSSESRWGHRSSASHTPKTGPRELMAIFLHAHRGTVHPMLEYPGDGHTVADVVPSEATVVI